MKDDTLVNHPPAVEVPADNHPVVAPIYQSVKFEFESVEQTLRALRGERGGFFYARSSNPTTRQLELTLAALQGREDCLVCASGVGGVAQTLLSLTRQGDHLLCFVETYGPTRQLIRRVLGRFGVTHTMLSIEDLAGIEAALSGRPTRLIIFESPTNPVNKIADIAAITRLARAHGALTVLDNTFAGVHQHGRYDVDYYLHSLTKYVAGHGDVLGGAVIAQAPLIRALRADFTVLGGVLDPHAAFLIQRGLKSYFVRYRQQSANALRVAEYLAVQPGVQQVRYPGLSSDPQHALARSQMSDFGAVVTFDLAGGAEAGRRFAETLELFAITPSLGATESLVMPPQLLGSRDLAEELQRQAGIGPGTVRLSIGLEDPEDLLADVARALAAARGAA
ncbi:MAG TPA: aminotransferase class I/II-fold pyridoxal phosphate-dependent enzyme [Steroidobacteraceae bacterium]|nr:aminotransferase class I/II-fold pyridoxal phosphate-dependent enzyme [Steroidobacteraceae bacterium]